MSKKTRLERAVADLRTEVTRLGLSPAGSAPILVILDEALAMRGDLDAAFDRVQAAERLLLASLSGDLLRAAAIRLRAEGRAKLRGWRRVAFDAILKDLPTDPVALGDAMRILQGHHQNTWHRIGATGDEVFLVCWLLVLACAAGGLTVGFFPMTVGAGETIAELGIGGRDLSVWGGLVLFLAGGVGALSSIGATLVDVGAERSLPDTALTSRVTLLRTLLGAAAGGLSGLFLFYGVIEVLHSSQNFWWAVSVAVIAGVTERILLPRLPTDDHGPDRPAERPPAAPPPAPAGALPPVDPAPATDPDAGKAVG